MKEKRLLKNTTKQKNNMFYNIQGSRYYKVLCNKKYCVINDTMQCKVLSNI